MLEAATGVKAFSVGKPSPVMMRTARKELGLTTDETIMIGDTMETDILGGVQLGFQTILVLSGGTPAEDPLRLSARHRRRFHRRPQSCGAVPRAGHDQGVGRSRPVRHVRLSGAGACGAKSV